MLPTVSILGHEITLYGILCLAGILAAILFSIFRAAKCGLPGEDVLYMGLLSAIGIVVGGKIVYLLLDIPRIVEYRAYIFGSFDQLIGYLSGGFVFYGGLFGAMSVIWLYCHAFKMDCAGVMACVVPSFPLAHAIGRIGCYCAGCCYGINGIPVQLYEAAGNLFIMAFLLLNERFGRKERALYLYLSLYAVMRFVLEFFRADEERGALWGVSTSQWISILVLLFVGVRICMLRARRVRNRE